jgi:hypothetical protein
MSINKTPSLTYLISKIQISSVELMAIEENCNAKAG